MAKIGSSCQALLPISAVSSQSPTNQSVVRAVVLAAAVTALHHDIP
jgi:hypothetical protein